MVDNVEEARSKGTSHLSPRAPVHQHDQLSGDVVVAWFAPRVKPIGFFAMRRDNDPMIRRELGFVVVFFLHDDRTGAAILLERPVHPVLAEQVVGQ
ncbi:hypothetical protein D3C84_888790 [compost metagenome]